MDERFLDIDQYGVLRVPMAFWLGAAVLVRYWILMIATMLSGQQAGAILGAMGGSVPWLAMAGEVFALAVVIAGGNRQPAAGVIFRWLWRHAHLLLVVTVICNLAWFALSVATSDGDYSRSQMVMASCALLDLCMAWVFTRSKYFRQLFSEFPVAVNR